ncbi:Lon protease-like protein [Oxalobacteraceae bacterium GrIS 1.11]
MVTIPLFPLNTVLFPDGHLPLQVFEVRYLEMVKQCISHAQVFGVVALLDGAEVRKPEQRETLAPVGTLARIVEWSAPLAGLLHIQCIGMDRFRIVSSERRKNGLWTAQVLAVAEDKAVAIPPDQQNVADALGALIRSLQRKKIPPEQMPILPPLRLGDCGWVANRWCELLALGLGEKQRLLSLENPLLRLELIQDLLSDSDLLG